jgi:hypothetical protein
LGSKDIKANVSAVFLAFFEILKQEDVLFLLARIGELNHLDKIESFGKTSALK